MKLGFGWIILASVPIQDQCERLQSRPCPALRQLLKRYLVCDALLAQYPTFGVHALLIGGAIGTDLDENAYWK